MSTILEPTDGLASSEIWQRYGFSYIHKAPDAYASTAMADAWDYESSMSLPIDMCDRVKAFAESSCQPITESTVVPGGPTAAHGVIVYVLGVIKSKNAKPRWAMGSKLSPNEKLPQDLYNALTSRMEAANRQWWGFNIDQWSIIAKRYTSGGGHRLHKDWQPDGGSQGRKLSSSFQLSERDEYVGGELKMVLEGGREIHLPLSKGALIVFPSWTSHVVEPVTSGERWSLLVNGWGPRLQ